MKESRKRDATKNAEQNAFQRAKQNHREYQQEGVLTNILDTFHLGFSFTEVMGVPFPETWTLLGCCLLNGRGWREKRTQCRASDCVCILPPGQPPRPLACKCMWDKAIISPCSRIREAFPLVNVWLSPPITGLRKRCKCFKMMELPKSHANLYKNHMYHAFKCQNYVFMSGGKMRKPNVGCYRSLHHRKKEA